MPKVNAWFDNGILEVEVIDLTSVSAPKIQKPSLGEGWVLTAPAPGFVMMPVMPMYWFPVRPKQETSG